ncbi:Xaa-Pro peptidase family protein [Mesorhizobium sp. M1340]|uniref:M24 family metallopeptidase n=1 Tax=Mesorhizobium sp. M1340 TaxID=2957087 RepID=UPI0033393823
MSRFVSEETSSMMGMSLPFTNGEYRRRIDAVRKRLVEEKLDALLMFHQESMFYLFGYDQTGYWIYQTALLTTENPEITLLSRVADHDLIAGLPYVGQVRTWKDDSADNPIEMTVDLLREKGLLVNGKRVGIELKTHALLPFYHKPLSEALPSLVDASDLITELRLCKSDAEVVYMREAGKVLDAAYAGAFAALRPGLLETEVLAAALTGMFKAGGHVPAIVPPFATGPRTMSQTHSPAVDRRILADEPVTIEPGCSRYRYHAVGVQTRWVGEPPASVQKVFDELAQTQESAFAAIRPGVSTAEVAREINRALDQFGMYVPGEHHGYGTGIGYPPTWLDSLRIKETDTHVLQKNMTFFLLFQWTVNDVCDFPVELFVGEPFIVTQSGCERLSSTPLSLT